jgi:hypothetical protein
VLVIWNAEKGVDVDAGDGADVEVMLSWRYVWEVRETEIGLW